MKKQIVLNCTPQETRVAVLEGKSLSELYIERSGERSVVGNIYKGRVQRVLPGMQAAFIEIGFDKAVFLHASDVRGGPASADEDAPEDDVEGVEAEEDQVRPLATVPSRENAARLPIEQKLSRGQEITVQVSKEPIGSKGARVTGQLSLAGRYLVYMPTTNHVGISRRIPDEEERQRLRQLVQEFRPPQGGFIVRTACEGLTRREIEADIRFLTRQWQRIERASGSASAPALLHAELDQVEKTVRDLFSPEVGRVTVDSQDEYERLTDLVASLDPRLKGRVRLHQDPEPIFDAFRIEEQIEKALDSRVPLRSGGSLVIEQTEALISIDVNTGRYVGKRNQDETILRTNLEAAEEIVRQLKLRNLGGLIILDLIDMDHEEHRTQVFEALAAAVRAKDKAQARILAISELGLVEMTRKRTRESLNQMLCAPCPHCAGSGRVKSPETVSCEILRRLRSEAQRHPGATRILVRSHPDVAEFLNRSEARSMEALEQDVGKKVIVKALESMKRDDYDLQAS